MSAKHGSNTDNYFSKVARIYIQPIADEIRNLLLISRVFWEVQSIIGKNSKLHSQGLFNNWMAVNYGASLTVGIRRQMDRSRTSISLAYLLRLFCCKPELVLRERFVSSYPTPSMRRWANEKFTELAGAGDAVDANIPLSDLNALEDAFHPIRRYANKRLAHRDIRAVVETPKFGELDDFLKRLADTFAKYFLLCLAQDRPFFEPKIVDPWKSVFLIPWIDRE